MTNNPMTQPPPRAQSRGLMRLLRDRRGATLVEYAMLAGLIAVAAIAAFRGFGTKVKDAVGKQGDTVSTIPTSEQ
jgi:Flp pilus assembly pilin Flp